MEEKIIDAEVVQEKPIGLKKVRKKPIPGVNEETFRKILREEIKGIYDELIREELLTLINENIEKVIRDMFRNNTVFEELRDHLIEIIEGEVESQIKNFDAHNKVMTMVQSYMSSHVKPIANQVIESIVSNVCARYSHEFRNAKNLVQSIDSEIRHFMMKLPINGDKEMEVVKYIKSAIKLEGKKIIFNKTEQSLI